MDNETGAKNLGAYMNDLLTELEKCGPVVRPPGAEMVATQWEGAQAVMTMRDLVPCYGPRVGETLYATVLADPAAANNGVYVLRAGSMEWERATPSPLSRVE